MADGTLVQRAAHYFGIGADEQWTSIKTDRLECILVADRTRRLAAPKGKVIAYYSEESRTTGAYIWLTEKQREALVEALS
jgi:hypothetical protein